MPVFDAAARSRWDPQRPAPASYQPQQAGDRCVAMGGSRDHHEKREQMDVVHTRRKSLEEQEIPGWTPMAETMTSG